VRDLAAIRAGLGNNGAACDTADSSLPRHRHSVNQFRLC
jgi:hypothetical protein